MNIIKLYFITKSTVFMQSVFMYFLAMNFRENFFKKPAPVGSHFFQTVV